MTTAANDLRVGDKVQWITFPEDEGYIIAEFHPEWATVTLVNWGRRFVVYADEVIPLDANPEVVA